MDVLVFPPILMMSFGSISIKTNKDVARNVAQVCPHWLAHYLSHFVVVFLVYALDFQGEEHAEHAEHH